MLRDVTIEKDDKPLHANRTLDVADEILARNLEMEKNFAHENTRDRTFQEFVAQYEDHINGEVDPALRTAGRPTTAFDEDGRPATNMRKTGMEGVPKEDPEGEARATKSAASGVRSRASHSRSIGSADSTFKFEVPNDCKLELNSKAVVTMLEENYTLLLHPFPQLQGEMILF